jgi:hypothetical protein
MTTRISGTLANLASEEPKVIIKKSCEYCEHLKVCAVFRAIKPLMENWSEEDRPFLPEDLANICKEWKPILP